MCGRPLLLERSLTSFAGTAVPVPEPSLLHGSVLPIQRAEELLATLRGHTAGIRGVALSRDAGLVASGSLDGTVMLWETNTGVALRALRADRRYERMDITGLAGVTAAQRAVLVQLGAVDSLQAP